MPGERIEITYEAYVKGIESIKDLSARTSELTQKNKELEEKIQRMTAASEKQHTALEKARHAILAFRKELFAITFVMGGIVVALKALSGNSDELSSSFEKLSMSSKAFWSPSGAFISKIFNQITGIKKLQDSGFFDKYTGAENVAERDLTVKNIEFKRKLQYENLMLQGRTEEALNRKLAVEKAQMEREIQTVSNGKEAEAIRTLFKKRSELLKEEQQYAELGLKRQFEIIKQFKMQLVDAFRGGLSDPIAKVLSGEKQGPMDVLKGFQTGIAHAIANAISETITSKLFGPSGPLGNLFSFLKPKTTDPTTVAVNKVSDDVRLMHQTLKNATDCICRTAENTAAMAANRSVARYEGTITPPKASTLSKIGAISNLVGAVAGAGALTGAGGAPAPGGVNNPSGNFANITMANGPLMHAGGFVRAYSSGGEIPITAQGGEFVVRKSVAMANKDFLTDFNMHGDSKRSKKGSGGNVFIIKANDAASFDQMLSTPSGRQQIETQVIRAIMENGNVRKIIRDFVR